jgi:hypothetical protein
LERLRGLFVTPVTIPLRGNATTRRHDDTTLRRYDEAKYQRFSRQRHAGRFAAGVQKRGSS